MPEVTEQQQQQIKLRKYLLGTIELEPDREEIEERLFFDADFLDELLAEEENLIEDYVDGQLTEQEERNFNNHFLISQERAENVAFVRAVRRYAVQHRKKEKSAAAEAETSPMVSDRSWRQRVPFLQTFRSHPRAFAGGFALVIIGLTFFFAWNFYSRLPNAQPALISLNNAYRRARPVESRLTDFDYAPFYQLRGEDRKSADARIDLTERNRAELQALDAAASPTAENLSVLGRLYLTKGDYEGALREFERALKMSPDNSLVYNDLGAAYLEKARLLKTAAAATEVSGGEQLKFASKALENFEKSIELNPRTLPARFNKALCLELLNAPREAQKAWRDYLNYDDGSSWANEAREHLKKLESNTLQSAAPAAILQNFFDAFDRNDEPESYRIISHHREMITGKLIPQQLAILFIRSPLEAEKQRYLEAIKYIGSLEKKRTGDAFFSALAGFYDSLAPTSFATLSAAQENLANGYQLSLKNQDRAALNEFLKARILFAAAGDDWEAALADYWIGYSYYRVNEIKKSFQTLEALAAFCNAHNYKWLASHAYNWLAINYIASKDYSQALFCNQKAVELAGATFDFYNTQKSLAQRADIYRRLGDYQQALSIAEKVLPMDAEPEASFRQKWRDYYSVADLFYAIKNYHTAAVYKAEALELARELGERSFLQTASVDLGTIYGTQGSFAKAYEFFAESRRVANDVPDEALRSKMMAYTDLQTGHVARQAGDCSRALRSYEAALRFYETGEYRTDQYDAHRGRLLCHLTEGQETNFEIELSASLNLLSEYRGKILEEQSSNLFFAREQDVFDIAIDYAVERHRYAQAFDYSEQSRARSLLDLQQTPGAVTAGETVPEVRFSARLAEPSTLVAAQEALPENVQILQYSVLKNRTLIWVISKAGLETAEASVSAEELQEKADAWREQILANDNPEAITKASIELYQILIAPVKDKLNPAKEICVIPDKTLFRVPFAALYSPEENDYLIASHSIFYAPSVSVLLNSLHRAQEFSSAEEKNLLSVGNPAFDRQSFPALPDLAAAETEARTIRGLYPNGALLTEALATKENVRQALPQADVIHFAGHYVVNENAPLLSGFVLAADVKISRTKASDQLLANYEIISGGRLPRARLIVLSACQTATDSVYHGEGMSGAARTFLAIGVPLVVASQWSVDSAATGELMISFQRYRKQEKLSTVQALRRAQLDVAKSNSRLNQPFYWAAFSVFGGSAADL